MTDLRGKGAFITGGSGGIGAATARAFAAAGARVALAARDTNGLAAVARTIGDAATTHRCDVRDPGEVARAVDGAVAALGGIDIVVPAAGLGRFAAVEDTTAEDWREIVEVNLTGTFLVFRATLPHVRRARGHLFAIASIAATRPFVQSAAYCAAKAGVRALAAVVAEETRGQGVRVTTIVPGAVDTPFWDRAGGTELDRSRMLRPEDVARSILHAAGEPSRTSIDEIVIMPPEGVL